jgi:hypothetical protein
LGQSGIILAAQPDALPAPESDTSIEKSLDEIAIDLINPVSTLFSIVNDFEYTTFQGSLDGADDQTRGKYLLTPVIPFPLDNGKNIMLRFTIPVNFGEPTYMTETRDYAEWLIRQFGDDLPTDGVLGKGHGFMDDISYDVAYGGVNDNGFISMFGVAGVLPVSRDGSIERDQFLLGPEVAFGKITDWGIVGAWATHLTNVANPSGVETDYDTNETSLKFFFAYGLGNGWQFISNPTITYDWEGANGNKLLFPIGGGFSKTTRIGKMPLKLEFELQNFIESPDTFGPEWLFTFSLTPVISDRFHK